MKPALTLILASAALASPALAEKPPCSTMESRPGGAPGWLAWGPVSSGQHVNLLGIPATWDADRALAELESYGFCTSTPPAPVEETAALTPLEENHQRLTQPDPTKPDSGLAGLAVVAVVLGALWASRDDDAPLADYRPRPIHQPHQDALLTHRTPFPCPSQRLAPCLASPRWLRWPSQVLAGCQNLAPCWYRLRWPPWMYLPRSLFLRQPVLGRDLH